MLNRKLRDYASFARLALRFVREDRLAFFGFIALSVVSAITEGVGVFLLVPLLETMGKNNIFSAVPMLGVVSQFFDMLPNDQRLIWAGSLMLIVVLLRGVLSFAVEVIGYGIPIRVDRRLRLEAFRTLLSTNASFADKVGAGDISNFTVAHPARVGIGIRFLALMLANICVLVTYVLLLTLLAPTLLAAAFVYVVVTTLLFRRFSSGLVTRAGRDLTMANQRFNQLFYETLNGAKLIRLSGAKDAVEDQVERALTKLERARLFNVALENMTVPFFSTLGGVLICFLVIFVGWLPQESAGPWIAVLAIFFLLMFRILAPLSIVNISRTNIVIHVDAFDDLERLFKLAEANREPDGTKELRTFDRALRFEDVTFSYSDGTAPAVSGITFALEKGQTLAIVGPSGSGKSTLINLLTRLYRSGTGRITVDGTDLNDVKIASWWNRLAVVSQDVFLFNDTIRNNIAFGLPGKVSDEAVAAAAKFASADQWIESLPNQYDTMLSDRGANLSGGQKQRLALARAFIRDADIYVFDEATSALDALTEAAVERSLASLRQRKTFISIVHKLESARSADAIVVLDGGQLSGFGSHGELMISSAMYRRLWDAQRARDDLVSA